jgi:hypothetical protein
MPVKFMEALYNNVNKAYRTNVIIGAVESHGFFGSTRIDLEMIPYFYKNESFKFIKNCI